MPAHPQGACHLTKAHGIKAFSASGDFADLAAPHIGGFASQNARQGASGVHASGGTSRNAQQISFFAVLSHLV
jgi:hypothetical protein